MSPQGPDGAAGRCCAICGANSTQGSHVKAERTFENKEDDRAQNIIQLCPSHHDLMDDGWVALSLDGTTALYKDGMEMVKEKLEYTINIRRRYIKWRNQYSEFVRPF